MPPCASLYVLCSRTRTARTPVKAAASGLGIAV